MESEIALLESPPMCSSRINHSIIISFAIFYVSYYILNSSNPNHSMCINYVIKFVSDLRQVGGFLRVLRFSPPIKLTATI